MHYLSLSLSFSLFLSPSLLVAFLLLLAFWVFLVNVGVFPHKSDDERFSCPMKPHFVLAYLMLMLRIGRC